MAITRRQLGVGLLAAGAGVTGTVAIVGPRRIESFFTGRSTDQVQLWGFIGGENREVRGDHYERDLVLRRLGGDPVAPEPDAEHDDRRVHALCTERRAHGAPP